MNDPLEVAREALEPFAKAAWVWPEPDDNLSVSCVLHVDRAYEATLGTEDFRKAREALSLLSESGNSSSVAESGTGVHAPDTLDFAKLEEVARAATPGPWESAGSSVTNWHDFTFEMEWIANGQENEDGTNANYRADAEYIATFDPPTVLRLIALAKQVQP